MSAASMRHEAGMSDGPAATTISFLPGRSEWAAALRAMLVIAAILIPIAVAVPAAWPWVRLIVVTLWFRGPVGVLIPVGLEPVLMTYGRIHPPFLVAMVALIGSAVGELVSLRLMRGVFALEACERLRRTVDGARVMRLFRASPFVAVAVGALSPIPDWMTRSFAAVSRYSPVRYILADTVGRIPKLWIAAAAGTVISVTWQALIALVAAQVVLGVGLWWWRTRRPRCLPNGPRRATLGTA
jgi:uncharacterized membrane protein YdjX (TVP38/TMEM64 family)